MTSTQVTPDSLNLSRLLNAELSRSSRFLHVALLVGSLTMAVMVGSLWVTEPALPARTQLAFAAMIVIGLSWAAFAVWVLTNRRRLLGRDSVLAARMAVTFTATFVVGALVLGITSGEKAPFAAATMGLALLAAAVALLSRARRRVDQLTARRQVLEREIEEHK